MPKIGLSQKKMSDIGILFIDSNEGDFVTQPYIADVSMSEGKIHYSFYEHVTKGNGLKTFHKESFEDAVKIVMKD